ncbi:hypothetical protein HU200_029304 [Digitaria exilis]|uniref:F-box domain-containing protein n=1 Tax=Digitaria exilis TaxID=1010633 RepID=A0A835EV22_9POAL|nr:hypothetical protein HU200_029304 [Digitaria exilis]
MATSTAEDSSPSWGDLLFDLICQISSHFHTATDYVRFHATCKPWRDTLPPATCRPAFLPWILPPQDATGHRKARCVFSSKSSRRAAAATEIIVPNRRWLIGADGGTSACLIDTATSSGI